ncbi:MAG: HpaII family restriction endonuclease [Bacteroides sp.]
MGFEATKSEWSELYVFLKLLAEGKVYQGNHRGELNTRSFWPISAIEREDFDGTRRYFIEDEWVNVTGKGDYNKLHRAALAAMADKVLELIKSSNEEEIACPADIEKFLNAAKIYELEPQTMDRTDIKLGFWSPHKIPSGFTIQSKLAPMRPLLDGGRAANLKMELCGKRFAQPEIENINAIDTPEAVRDRMLMLEQLGGSLKYADVAHRVFRCNINMIDLHFGRILAEMIRAMHLQGKTRIYELTNLIKMQNPVKVKEDLIQKHRFYEYKMKQFLMAAVSGMRPAKIFNGTDSEVEGMLVLNADGSILAYHKEDRKTYEDFLYLNTRFLKGPLDKDKYGFLEREHGTYYMKLNAKIGLVKR